MVWHAIMISKAVSLLIRFQMCGAMLLIYNLFFGQVNYNMTVVSSQAIDKQYYAEIYTPLGQLAEVTAGSPQSWFANTSDQVARHAVPKRPSIADFRPYERATGSPRCFLTQIHCTSCSARGPPNC